MGQRLNFEVCCDGKVLANAYYHWSAYTSSSLEMLGSVIQAYNKRSEINPLKVAVEILQFTNAGVNKTEKERIAADTTGKFKDIVFNDCIDRNTGLLAVTPEGIEETRKWEEGRVTMDIGSEEFIFDVLWMMDNDEYDECREPGSAQMLPDTYIDFRAPCPFRDYQKFKKGIMDNPDGVRLDDDSVLCWIE